RMESLTKKFATPIVASAEFMTYCGGEWESLGSETLRGVNNPIAVFRPTQTDRQPEAPIVKRSRVGDFSDAEAVMLLHRRKPPPTTPRGGAAGCGRGGVGGGGQSPAHRGAGPRGGGF